MKQFSKPNPASGAANAVNEPSEITRREAARSSSEAAGGRERGRDAAAGGQAVRGGQAAVFGGVVCRRAREDLQAAQDRAG